MFHKSSIKQSPKVVFDRERLQKLASELVELNDDHSAQLRGGDKWEDERADLRFYSIKGCDPGTCC